MIFTLKKSIKMRKWNQERKILDTNTTSEMKTSQHDIIDTAAKKKK